jgi:hypothetical protein
VVEEAVTTELLQSVVGDVGDQVSSSSGAAILDCLQRVATNG